jgi:hypothetical protein
MHVTGQVRYWVSPLGLGSPFRAAEPYLEGVSRLG